MTKALELMPGDVALGLAGDRLKTLLGSCVTVVLTDPARTVGAMCHIVHVGKPMPDKLHDTAYGEAAMARMFALLQANAVIPQRCEAYVYGGGNMFPKVWTKNHVGANNAAWVLDFLQRNQIKIVEQSLGGNVYRKVAWTVGPQKPVVDAEKSE